MKQIFTNPRRKLIVAFSLLVCMLALAACAADNVSPAAPAIVAAGPGISALEASLNDSLHAWKDREKDRIAAEADRSVPVYDSLHALWSLTHKPGRKAASAPTVLLECEPQPYAADVQIVGPEGATFTVGPHRFYIPAGALTQETVITVEQPVSNHAELDFAPHGLHFAGATYMLLDYHGCDLGTSRQRSVAYTDSSYHILEARPSFDQKKSYGVWGATDHFSHYVVTAN